MRVIATKMLDAVIVTGASAAFKPVMDNRTFQAVGATTAGAGAATIVISGSNDGVNFITIGTITLTLSSSESSDGFASDAAWKFVNANVTAISGTNAAVTVYLGA